MYEKHFGITSPYDLFKMRNNWVYVVTNPVVGTTPISYSCFMPWRVGNFYYTNGSLISTKKQINEIETILVEYQNLEKDKNGKKYRYYLNLSNYNNKSNNKIFTLESDARAYQLWLKMSYESSYFITENLENIFMGYFLDYSSFTEYGLIDLSENGQIQHQLSIN